VFRCPATFRVLDKVFKNFGITYEIIDTTDLSALPEKLTPDVWEAGDCG